MSSNPRILVLQPDKGLAEGIYRAIRSMRGLNAEVDVALAGDVDIPGIRLDRYDLLIVEQMTLARSAGEPAVLDTELPFPVITVGGPPNGTPRTGNELLRGPLPLSFNLREESVRAALAGLPELEEEETPRKDSTG